MKQRLLHALLPLFALGAVACTHDTTADEEPVYEPQYTEDNQLIRPEGYREWIYLSSGLGMSYNPAFPPGEDPPFDNVFVPPPAYQAFKKTGTWPDKTIFVLELRTSSTRGAITTAGHFQAEIATMEAEVKDEARFPDKWAYFGFGDPGAPLNPIAPAMPKDLCFSCHEKNAAVEHTFVQFYPTLFEIAERKGTLRGDYPKE